MASMTVAAAPPDGGGSDAEQALRKDRKRWTGWLFIIPFLLVFAAFLVAPLVYSIYLSLFQDKLIGGTSFVGFDNYRAVFTDPKFWSALKRVAIFLVVQVPIMTVLALVAALGIDSGRLKGSGLYRILLFLPYAVPGVVATLIWGFMYGDKFGLTASINNLLGTHLAPLVSSWILVSIGNIVTWEFMGYNMLIFYSSLKVIPTELYEAAEVDGAGAMSIVRYIKIPALRGSIVISIIFSIIGSFQLFNEPNLLQPLAPNAITTNFTPNLYAYNLSFAGQQINYAATVAIVMGVVTAVIAYVVQLRGSRKETMR